MSTQALAARFVRGPQGDAIRAALGDMRDDARTTDGVFQTNVTAIEDAGPEYWQPQRTWDSIDGNGLAVPTLQCGDWHLVPVGKDGYGNFGLNEENGGALLGTTALIMEAGIYAGIYSDWKGLTAHLARVRDQLEEEHVWALPELEVDMLSGPLDASHPEYLQTSVIDPDVKAMCEARRGYQDFISPPDPDDRVLAPRDKLDEEQCDYYQNLQHYLPENGAYVFAFVEGVLGLDVDPDGTIAVYGSDVPIEGGAGPVAISLPANASQSWPSELAEVHVDGLWAGGSQISLGCRRNGALLWCEAETD
jgi:hypothetical protein